MLLLFPSAEVRWFYPGQPPAALDAWFHSGELWRRAAPRTDVYLYFPHSDTVGVKFREGRFEIKAFVSDLGNFAFAPGLSGKVEQWEKWSLNLGQMDLPADSQWIAVEKSRTLRRFRLPGGQAEEMAADSYPDEGCNAELTRISVFKQPWWSFALESFGKMARTEALLKAAGQQLLGGEQGFPAALSLDPAHSLSYPAWLRQRGST